MALSRYFHICLLSNSINDSSDQSIVRGGRRSYRRIGTPVRIVGVSKKGIKRAWRELLGKNSSEHWHKEVLKENDRSVTGKFSLVDEHKSVNYCK